MMAPVPPQAVPRHDVKFLGGVEFHSPAAGGILQSRPSRIALLAWLAVHTDVGPRQRDEIIGIFWPESGEENARASLRQSLHVLRRALGDRAIRSLGTAVQLDPALVSCDVVDFDRAVREGRDAEAVRLYRGHFLEGLIVSGAYEVTEWIAVMQRRRWEHMLWAAIRLAEDAFSAGNTHAAVRTAQRVVDLLPGNERLHHRLEEILRAYGGTAAVRAT